MTGTDLCRLGVHAKQHEWMSATMNRDGQQDIFLVTGCKVTKIEVAKAKDLLAKYDWQVKNGVISHNGDPVARIDVE